MVSLRQQAQKSSAPGSLRLQSKPRASKALALALRQTVDCCVPASPQYIRHWHRPMRNRVRAASFTARRGRHRTIFSVGEDLAPMSLPKIPSHGSSILPAPHISSSLGRTPVRGRASRAQRPQHDVLRTMSGGRRSPPRGAVRHSVSRQLPALY